MRMFSQDLVDAGLVGRSLAFHFADGPLQHLRVKFEADRLNVRRSARRLTNCQRHAVPDQAPRS